MPISETLRPPPRYGHAMAVSPTHLFVYGGFNSTWFDDLYAFAHGDDIPPFGRESSFTFSNGLAGLQEDLLSVCNIVNSALRTQLRAINKAAAASASSIDSCCEPPLSASSSTSSLLSLSWSASASASRSMSPSSMIERSFSIENDLTLLTASSGGPTVIMGEVDDTLEAATTAAKPTSLQDSSDTLPYGGSRYAPLPGEQDHLPHSTGEPHELDSSVALLHDQLMAIRCPRFDFRTFAEQCTSAEVLHLLLAFFYTDDVRFVLQRCAPEVEILIEAAHWAHVLQLERLSALLETAIHLRITHANVAVAHDRAKQLSVQHIVSYVDWYLVETQEPGANTATLNQPSSAGVIATVSDEYDSGAAAPMLWKKVPASTLVADMERLLSNGMAAGDFELIDIPPASTPGTSAANTIGPLHHYQQSLPHSHHHRGLTIASSPPHRSFDIRMQHRSPPSSFSPPAAFSSLSSYSMPGRYNDNLASSQQAEPEQIRVFKALLRVRCPYFASMFDMGGRDAMSRTSQVRDISMSVLTHLVRYIYTGQFPTSATMVECLDLMVALVYYQLDQHDQSVVESCDAFITANLKVENCLDVCRLAFERGLVEVQRKATQMIAKNYGRVITSADILHSMDQALVIEILHACNSLLWSLEFAT